MSLEAFLELLNHGGVLVLLTAILLGGWRGWWMFGPVHKEIVARLEAELARVQSERDRLFDLALQATEQAGRAVEHLTTQTKVSP